MIFFLNRVKTVPLSRSMHGHRVRQRTCFFSRHLVDTAVQLLQSLALHLRILFEDLRVSLAKQSNSFQVAIRVADKRGATAGRSESQISPPVAPALR
jgi:hypothetical protein